MRNTRRQTETNYILLLRAAALIAVLILAATGCSRWPWEKAPESSDSTSSCKPTTSTAINGVKNEAWVTLDAPGGHHSQIHLQAANSLPGGYSDLVWSPSPNRINCSRGYISGGTGNYFLQVSYNPTALYMQLVAGDNYFDYVVRGCREVSGTKNCDDTLEAGTYVVHVNYTP